LRILLNMLYLCLDMIKPEDIDYSAQSFDSTLIKSIRLTNVLRSLSIAAESTDKMRDRIESLDKLLSLSNYGCKYCEKIKIEYRIANEILKVNFKNILSIDQWSILKTILTSSNHHKYEIAQKYVSINELDEEDICNFLLDKAVETIHFLVTKQRDGSVNESQVLMFNSLSNNQEFSKLIKLFRNPAVFGSKLLDKTKELLLGAQSSEDFLILTEILIRAHDCFAQSCSMEGISNVLQVSKECAHKLEKVGEFNIMLRLLTGIAHYNEMIYIMDILWNSHQFEMLFGKGMGKDNKLRLSVLDYLKRYHPNDHETYTMVTLNFTMFREIAKMLEEAAIQQLKILENKTIENTSEILTDLQSILQYFSDAAQSYIKEDCVRQSENCIRKARLIALQIHFLSSNRVIVNLNANAVTKFIISHSKFWEAYIVSEAYQRSPDLPQALFHQFIVNNNEKYLLDYKNHIGLSSIVIEEVANRFKMANESSKLHSQCATNMRKLLKYCKDVTVYYKLAQLLDFRDTVSEIMSRNYSSIINDLISLKKLN